MAKKTEKDYVWKDRKRYLGLPLSFTRYSIRNQRLYLSKGFFNTSEDELLLYRILDVKLDRTFGNKIVGVGTVTIYTADKTNPEIKLTRIKNAKEVRDLISKAVEEERERLNIRGKEMYGVSDNDLRPEDSDADNSAEGDNTDIDSVQD